MRRHVWRLLALAAVVLLSGCSSSSSKQSAPQDAVKQAYLGYWRAALSAQASPSGAADLGAVATGSQLKADQALVQQRLHAGERVAGSYDHRATVADVHGATATVRDCMTAHLTVAGPHGPHKVPAGPYSVRATMVEAKGTWRVQQIAEDNRTCPAAASAAPSARPTGTKR